jgi:hypothetical protein
MKKIIIGILPFLFLSFAASLISNFTEKIQPLSQENKVTFLPIKHPVSNEVKMDRPFKYVLVMNRNGS